MPTFQTSKYSPRGNPAETSSAPSQVTVKDSQGTAFRAFRSTGYIELESTGRLWKPGTASYTAVLANLARVGDNATVLATVLDARSIMAAVEASKAQLPAVRGEAAAAAAPPQPKLWESKLFWPGVILTLGSATGLAIWFWPKEK